MLDVLTSLDVFETKTSHIIFAGAAEFAAD